MSTSMTVYWRIARARYELSAIVALTATMLYPFLLLGFHATVGVEPVSIPAYTIVAAAAWLASALAVPLLCLVCAIRIAGRETLNAGGRRALRLCQFGVAAPTVYVFMSVMLSMLGSPVSDFVAWVLLWFPVGFWCLRPDGRPVAFLTAKAVSARWRVAHGVAASAIAIFVMFHIFNHLFGLIGPDAHARVMHIGRQVYRLFPVQLTLVLLLLFQIGSGLRLAWDWSGRPAQPYRVFQTASGIYLSLFILGHMNSVFVYARQYRKIDTDWAFATGAPTGLIHDAWNIRLLPHYWLGVFLVLSHLATGLRVVLAAHGVPLTTVARAWFAGLAASAAVSTAIIAGMCGVRI